MRKIDFHRDVLLEVNLALVDFVMVVRSLKNILIQFNLQYVDQLWIAVELWGTASRETNLNDADLKVEGWFEWNYFDIIYL